MIEADVRTVLLAAGALTALVSQHVFMVMAEEGAAAPYVVFQTILGRRDTTLVSGAGRTRTARIQFDCYHRNSLGARAIADAVTAALVAATQFKAVYLSDQDAWDFDPNLMRVVLEFSISQTDP